MKRLDPWDKSPVYLSNALLATLLWATRHWYPRQQSGLTEPVADPGDINALNSVIFRGST